MARYTEIEYIRFYTDGSAARQTVEKTAVTAPSPVPRRKRAHRKLIRIYPVETLACVVACILAVMMVVGMVQCIMVNAENRRLANYVEDLQTKNEYLAEQYDELVDLEQIEKTALAIGMVPAAEAERITISVSAPSVEPAPTLWQNVVSFLTALFA